MNNTPALSIQGQCFIDPEGRQVLLHGSNWVNKDRLMGYLMEDDPASFARLRDWGFNCLRLGLIWDGLEPQPGTYNEIYLRGIDRQIELAHQYGLFVLLDMHQDLFSVRFADGAPEWATLTGGQPHITSSTVWSDAYFTSPAVQASLDNFWDNAPAPDGIGIQEHYARLWGMLARRYRNHPGVIGYDLMNEPFLGAQALQIHELMFSKGAELLTGTGIQSNLGPDIDPVEAVGQMWLTPTGRFAILQILRDLNFYQQVIDVTQPLYNQFEQEQLMGMYRRVAQCIRQEDAAKIIFLETSMGSNMGVLSAIQPLIQEDGKRDPQQAYAPHGYDLVTDTENISQASPERIELIFHRHAETAKRQDMPMLVGEWGAYGDTPHTRSTAWQVVNLFENLLCSETYWTYIPGIEHTDSFQALQRPFPERVAGKLLRYRCEPDSRIFTCVWQEDKRISAPSRIYLPDWLGCDLSQIKLNPWVTGFQAEPILAGSDNVILEIPPSGENLERVLEIG